MPKEKQETKGEKKKGKFKQFVRRVKRVFGGKEISPLPPEEGKTSKPNLTPEKQKQELNQELLQAVIDNKIEEVKTYLKLGGDVNYKIKEGKDITGIVFPENSTLLIIASVFGYIDIVDELIKYGADVNAREEEGWVALMKAVWKGRTETVKYLLSVGANPLLKNKEEKTVYDWADIQKIKQALEKYMKKWELIGEEKVLKLELSIKNCSPTEVKEIFENL